MIDDLTRLAEALAERLRARRLTLSTAESCTGGLLGHGLTNVPGSSDWYVGGVVAYSNVLKTKLLGVAPAVLAGHGAVSEQCVRAMAEGMRRVAGSDLALAISGIAGPTGGTPDKPVGTVWMAWALSDGVQAERFTFSGERAMVKHKSVLAAMGGLIARLS